jgi:hypothetical protein
MTLSRKLALRISDFVARHASPGCKEWAEAMAREAAYIDGDWAALGWALSSTRILLDRRRAPKQRAPIKLFTLAQVPSAARDFVKESRSAGRPMFYTIMTGTILEGEIHRSTPQWQLTAGFAISAIGAAVCCALWLFERSRLENPAEDTVYGDPMRCVRFYRSELQRFRITMWFPYFAWLCLAAGEIVSKWSFLCANRWFFVGWALGYVLIFTTADYAWWKNQRRLEQLDALLAEKP